MGVAPREPGRLNTIPPRENGGNIDIRHLTPGSTLSSGAGDGRAVLVRRLPCAQGDGEVNGTGIETPMTVTLRFGLLKRAQLPGTAVHDAAAASR